jgi:hypothetical protein
MIEPELSITRRAFPEAQALLAGPVSRQVTAAAVIGWHDTTAHGETGAVAVVRRGGPYEDLVGEVLRVETSYAAAYVYCAARADVVEDLSLARRAMLSVAPLAEENISASIGIV